MAQVIAISFMTLIEKVGKRGLSSQCRASFTPNQTANQVQDVWVAGLRTIRQSQEGIGRVEPDCNLILDRSNRPSESCQMMLTTDKADNRRQSWPSRFKSIWEGVWGWIMQLVAPQSSPVGRAAART